MANLDLLSLTTTLDFWVIFRFEGVAILDVEPGEPSSMETWSLWIAGLAFLVFKVALDFLFIFCFGGKSDLDFKLGDDDNLVWIMFVIQTMQTIS